MHRHHRQLRRHGNDGWPNVISLTPELHADVHAHPRVAYEYGLLVHSWDDPAAIPADVEGYRQARLRGER